MSWTSGRVYSALCAELETFEKQGPVHKSVADVIRDDYLHSGNDVTSGSDYACNVYNSVGNSTGHILAEILYRRHIEFTVSTVSRELPIVESVVSIFSWWADRAENGDLD